MRTLSFLVMIFCLVIMLIVKGQGNQILQKQQILNEINQKLFRYGQMNFLNQNLIGSQSAISLHDHHDLFDKMKIRKFTSAKINLGEKLKLLQNKISNQQIESGKISNFDSHQALLQKINIISTVGLTSKKFEGLNFYTHILFHYQDKFFSVEGSELLNVDYTNQVHSFIHNMTKQTDFSPILVSSLRNQNFYVARYVSTFIESEKAECLNIKISQVQMKNKQLVFSQNAPFRNTIIHTKLCSQKDIKMTQLYYHFFTYNTYQSKPSYYIFTTQKEIHFYFYSQMIEELVMDQNKTIKFSQLFNQNDEKIEQIVKLNTHLIILTNRNNIFSVNLLSLLTYKKTQCITFYESISLQFENMHKIKFNDNDYRIFYVLGDRNIYQYKLSEHKIVKKYVLKHSQCENVLTCTENIWVLQNYIMVQMNVKQNKNNQVVQEFYLIDKSTGQFYQFQIPFSHQDKCSQHKRIFITKNKISHYIITLACFMKQNFHLFDQSNVLNNSVKSQPSDYLILQHLNLQTSNQIQPSGQLGGVDFTKFRLPMIIFSIGLVCYITVKRSKKSPQNLQRQEKLQQKFQQQVLSTIRRQKQRQQALKMVRKRD